MRPFLLLFAALCPAWALGDRLILVPLGKKIPYGTVRLEHMFDQSEHDRFRSTLGIGLTESIDAELTYEEGERNRGRVTSYDVSYNIVPPITNLTPGFSVGVRDGTGKTLDGRFAYAAMTERFGQTGTFTSESPAEVTLGVAYGDRNAGFVAAMLPVRESFRVLMEYDTVRVSGGLEFRPHPDLWVRWIHREHQALWSLTLVHKL